MSDTTEQATVKDFVERFRNFSLRLETYPTSGDGDFVYEYDAVSTTTPQHV